MTTGFLFYLVKNDLPVKPLSEITQTHDASQPTEGEVRVHGYVNAVVKARKAFIRNAIDAIVDAKHGRGLDSYYRDYADPHLFAAIQWGCLFRDIMVCFAYLGSIDDLTLPRNQALVFVGDSFSTAH